MTTTQETTYRPIFRHEIDGEIIPGGSYGKVCDTLDEAINYAKNMRAAMKEVPNANGVVVVEQTIVTTTTFDVMALPRA